MANDIRRIREALQDAERIRSAFGPLQEDVRQSAPGFRQTLAALERDLGQLIKGAERDDGPLEKMARGEELTADERKVLKLR